MHVPINKKPNTPHLPYICSYASSIINKNAESAYIWGFRIQILRIPLTFAHSTYNLLNPLTVAESRKTSYICLLRNPQQIKCADKSYITGICTRNSQKCCRRNPPAIWNMFKISLWNPGTYRHKIVRLSSAQFSLLVMFFFKIKIWWGKIWDMQKRAFQVLKRTFMHVSGLLLSYFLFKRKTIYKIIRFLSKYGGGRPKTCISVRFRPWNAQ